MKSLIESIFDKDLAKQSVYIGDLYELDEWTIPARGKEYEFTDDILRWGIKATCGLSLGGMHWQKHLKPIDSFPEVTNNQCFGSYFLKYVTEIILCCSSVKQIPEEVRKYILECRNNPSTYRSHKDQEFIKKYIFKDVQVQTLDMKKEPLRMVVIKFIMDDENDHIVCVTFKKRN